ncbi:MAG TPA: Holliday junction resolvase RuvX [Candidatus Dormibacteraeota bacterium]|nr:Holliday junction resolvase RuvX [Candidatus Dormibacteraeota bacterium]
MGLPRDYNFAVGRLSPKVAHASKPEGSRTQGAETRILAIDYGRRRIGLAISDPMGWIATPLATIERKGRAADMARLQELARQHGVGRVIVGHPLKMDGAPGEMAEEAARFARRVEQELAVPVDLVDERLTSWEARQWQLEQGKAGARGQDEIAAAILLQQYLGRSPEDGG